MASSIDPRVDVGYVHPKVADIPRALAFWHDVLGFDVMHRYGDERGYTSSSSGIDSLLFGRLENPCVGSAKLRRRSERTHPSARRGSPSAAAMAGLCSCSLHSLLNPPRNTVHGLSGG